MCAVMTARYVLRYFRELYYKSGSGHVLCYIEGVCGDNLESYIIRVGQVMCYAISKGYVVLI